MFTEIFNAIKGILLLVERVEALVCNVEALALEVREMDRRLVHLETFLDFMKFQAQVRAVQLPAPIKKRKKKKKRGPKPLKQ